MKKHLVLLIFLFFFLKVSAQQSININTLIVTTQPTRFEVARIYIDVVNWNMTGNLEIDLKEKLYSAGLKKTYTVSYGYLVSPQCHLKDMSGIGANDFQLSMGPEVTVSGTIRYVPVYIDLRNYARVDVVLRTNWQLTTDVANTSQGYLYYNQSPTGFNIDDFSPDATVYLSNSAANTILSGSVGIGTTIPGLQLHVNGSTGFPATSGTAQTGALRLQGSSSQGVLDLGVNGGSGAYLQVTNQTDLSQAYPLILNPNGGSIGIGTTNPADIFEVAKTITAKFKIFKPTGYSYPSDFGTGVIGLGLTRYDGVYTSGMYAYTSLNGDNNLAIGSRSQIVFLAGNSELGYQPEAMRIKDNGYVGIGTTNPSAKLDVAGSTGTNDIKFENYSPTTTGVENQSMIFTGSDNSGTNKGNFELLRMKVISTNGGTPLSQIQFLQNGSSTPTLAFSTDGNVGIGTPTIPANYKLEVAGNAIAESMTVKLQANWPDVVFKKNYALMPLSDVKTYIDKNQHLPEIPAAAEIEKDGVNLGEMNRLLVKKVEELTLYLIEIKKELDELKSQKSK